MKKILARYFHKKGIDNKRSLLLANMFIQDWNVCNESFSKKIWALYRGFRPTRIQQYGLTKDNFKDYLSDVDYFRLHPINNHFAFWVNDKITLKYMLPNSIKVGNAEMQLMPQYYLYIENDGHFSYLLDAPNDIVKDINFLYNLLLQKKVLAMKPSNGAGGVGFVKLSYSDDNIYWNEEIISQSELTNRLCLLNGYIVTEYFYQHQQLKKVWPTSENTLRIVAIKNIDDKYDGGKIDVISSYVRFGAKVSKGVCNMAAGGLNLAFDFNTGKYGDFMNRHKRFCEDDNIRFIAHPDTNESLVGQSLPHIEKVQAAVYALCNHLSSLEYFGIDIIVGDNDVKVLEVNTLPGLDSMQILDGPLFKNPIAAKFFAKKLSKKG